MTQNGKVFLLDTEIQGVRVKDTLERAPMYPVVRFISAAEFERHSKDIMCRHVVKEGIRNMSGKLIIVHYIKTHSK